MNRKPNGSEDLFRSKEDIYDKLETAHSLDGYQGALVFSAVANALAWPTEFMMGRPESSIHLPLKHFIRWKKVVGGRWWGYTEDIEPGQYSDDTQLTLAVARCIDDSGKFEPQRFAYLELPLWLHYEMGGGRSIKTAARALISGSVDWTQNFYKKADLDYTMAGSNGAAMRNLPIALVNIQNEERLIRDSIYNALITHGHPRAIIGTVLFGAAIRYVLMSDYRDLRDMLVHLDMSLEHSWLTLDRDPTISEWVRVWDRRSKKGNKTFGSLFLEVLRETRVYLDKIPKHLERSEKDYYSLIGALEPSTKGSGIGTVCAAIYLFMKMYEDPEKALYTVANILGSDTDTIASFLGALLGAKYGQKAIPKHLLNQLQDYRYMLDTARRLYDISVGDLGEKASQMSSFGKREAYVRILAWEMGLHEMFWEAIHEGEVVFHPTLGRGVIKQKEVKPIRREGYVAKLLRVEFDCGQSCIFHSRVKDNNIVLESLARDVDKALRGMLC